MNEYQILEQRAIPFLRWAGGKKWLVKELSNILSTKKIKNYHEPFLGGGAIFFSLNPNAIAYLNDLNTELIETYKCVKDDIEGLIKELKKFENTEEFYYIIRDQNYQSQLKKAARFIFLNQTSFNGIYRVNLKGKYNVPYGYRNKEFFNAENLRRVSKRLKNSVLESKDFSLCINNIKKNDLVFLDPPYTITHNNNGFFKYNQKLFSENDQYRLSEFIDEIKNKKAFYIMTNAAHDKVKAIFDKGDKIMELKRASLVGGANAKRGKYAELLITNITK
jgi:DNA adenine methylase